MTARGKRYSTSCGPQTRRWPMPRLPASGLHLRKRSGKPRHKPRRQILTRYERRRRHSHLKCVGPWLQHQHRVLLHPSPVKPRCCAALLLLPLHELPLRHVLCRRPLQRRGTVRLFLPMAGVRCVRGPHLAIRRMRMCAHRARRNPKHTTIRCLSLNQISIEFRNLGPARVTNWSQTGFQSLTVSRSGDVHSRHAAYSRKFRRKNLYPVRVNVRRVARVLVSRVTFPRNQGEQKFLLSALSCYLPQSRDCWDMPIADGFWPCSGLIEVPARQGTIARNPASGSLRVRARSNARRQHLRRA